MSDYWLLSLKYTKTAASDTSDTHPRPRGRDTLTIDLRRRRQQQETTEITVDAIFSAHSDGFIVVLRRSEQGSLPVR